MVLGSGSARRPARIVDGCRFLSNKDARGFGGRWLTRGVQSRHHDSLAAQAEGLPTWFPVGMYHAGLLCSYVVAWLGVEPLRRFRVRFLDVTWPGDVLTWHGAVSGIEVRGGEKMASLDPAAKGPSGAEVTRAWADLAAP